jgi:hypothetical protein
MYCGNIPKTGAQLYEIVGEFKGHLSKRICCKNCFLAEYASKIIPEFLTKKARETIIAGKV